MNGKQNVDTVSALKKNLGDGIVIPIMQNKRLPTLLIDHWARLSNAGISSLCHPLHQYGIYYFLYVKRFKRDGSQIEITNNVSWSEYYYDKGCYSRTSFNNDLKKQFENQTFLWSSTSDEETLQDFREGFSLDNGITLIVKRSDGNEFFSFAGKVNDYQLLNFYLNHLSVLRHFILYFKDKYYELIKQAEKCRLLIPDVKPITQKVFLDQDFSILMEEMPIDRYYISPYANVYLTKREASCLKWYIHGKTALEIAIIIGVSKRTIEVHIENIKRKLGCLKQSQLGHKLAKLFEIL